MFPRSWERCRWDSLGSSQPTIYLIFDFPIGPQWHPAYNPNCPATSPISPKSICRPDPLSRAQTPSAAVSEGEKHCNVSYFLPRIFPSDWRISKQISCAALLHFDSAFSLIFFKRSMGTVSSRCLITNPWKVESFLTSLAN